MDKDVYKIALSAGFSDLGYQAVVASFPLLLVFYFHVPIFIYGIVESFSYGIGLFFSFLGGFLSDKFGSKKIAIFGNSLIVLLSFTGLAKDAIQAISLFLSGWFMRNFRSPARRAMVAEITKEEERKRAYGILHALDVGGGFLAIVYLTIFLYYKVPLSLILPFTAIPITIGTIFLVISKSGKPVQKSKENTRIILGVLIATALFGIATYSPGFPIITVTQSTNELYLGALTYGIYLGSSAIFGYVFSWIKIKDFVGLISGYSLAFLANLGFVFLFRTGILGLYPIVFLLGVAFASAETFEPSIISKVSGKNVGREMGLLSLARGVGYFIGNTTMGFLYSISYSYAYIFSSIIALTSVIVILVIIRTKK
ncbi:MFS transporter [Acidianus sulfidivorans JP7]|uniref:MFS transporter n=1 Tax=Acidianus sulfidivorans JP7 TaxID=619593 RepID=A0A2U9IQF5_9CREN|nr:MFS transporter [Acidianus sulfidivorans]AWR98214.1 MFS transporter [Acidianus sulfidivorans JP7]